MLAHLIHPRWMMVTTPMWMMFLRRVALAQVGARRKPTRRGLQPCLWPCWSTGHWTFIHQHEHNTSIIMAELRIQRAQEAGRLGRAVEEAMLACISSLACSTIASISANEKCSSSPPGMGGGMMGQFGHPGIPLKVHVFKETIALRSWKLGTPLRHVGRTYSTNVPGSILVMSWKEERPPVIRREPLATSGRATWPSKKAAAPSNDSIMAK